MDLNCRRCWGKLRGGGRRRRSTFHLESPVMLSGGSLSLMKPNEPLLGTILGCPVFAPYGVGPAVGQFGDLLRRHCISLFGLVPRLHLCPGPSLVVPGLLRSGYTECCSSSGRLSSDAWVGPAVTPEKMFAFDEAKILICDGVRESVSILKTMVSLFSSRLSMKCTKLLFASDFSLSSLEIN